MCATQTTATEVLKSTMDSATPLSLSLLKTKGMVETMSRKKKDFVALVLRGKYRIVQRCRRATYSQVVARTVDADCLMRD